MATRVRRSSSLIAGLCGWSAAILLISQTAQSNDYFWIRPEGGSFDLPSNWSPFGPPHAGDNAIFNLNSAGYAVAGGSEATFVAVRILDDTLTGLPDAMRVSIGSDASTQGTLAVQSSFDVNVNASAPSGGLWVGENGDGTLSVQSSANIVGQWVVADGAASSGTVTIDFAHFGTPGFGNPLGMTSATIGKGGVAIFNANRSTINLAGPFIAAQLPGSQATITVDDNSIFGTPGFGGPYLKSVTVGQGGVAALNVKDRSTANFVGPFVVGQESTARGEITVDHSTLGTPGFGAFAMTSAMIGDAGYGSLSVVNRGNAYLTGPLTIGKQQSSEGVVLVDGFSSSLGPAPFGAALIPSIVIGDAGSGSVSVSNGGSFYLAGPSILGNEVGSTGSVVVDGFTSRLVTYGFNPVKSLTIGSQGSGSLSVGNAGLVNLPAPVAIAQSRGSLGSLSVDGFLTSFASQTVYVGGSSQGPGGAGSMVVSNSATFTAPSLTVYASGSVELTAATINADVQNAGVFVNNGVLKGSFDNQPGGWLGGAGTIDGPVILEPGSQLAPGNSPGTLNVGSVAWQGDAEWRFQINSALGSAGADPGWSLLAVTGTIDLQGTPSDPMRVTLASLLPDNAPGDVMDFDSAHQYLWTFVTASDGIHGFSPGSFAIDVSGFSNFVGSGHFEIQQVGQSLALAYVVPEPDALALALIALMGLGLKLLRGRRLRGFLSGTP